MDQLAPRIGQSFWLLFWVLLLVLLAWLFSMDKDSKVQTISPHHIVLQQASNGHFIAQGAINGFKVSFLVDTGASSVVVPEHISQKINLEQGPQVPVYTAGGTKYAWMTRIESFQIEGIRLTNIRALINPFMDDDEVLLGMSALKKLEMHHSDGKLELIQR